MKNRDYMLKNTINTHLFRKMLLKQWRMLLIIVVFLWIGMFGVSYSQAATIHVDCQNGTPDGSNGFYNTISGAVAAAATSDIIRVHAGTTCMESATINVNKTGLRILGDNPANTKVTHPPGLSSVNVFTISASSVEIAGLTITGSGDGVYINAISPSASIHNNHINYNKVNGIYIGGNLGDAGIIYNNIIKGNTLDGVYSVSIGTAEYAHSNIITGNGDKALSGVDKYYYNSTYANGTNAGTNNGNINQNCFFVNESANPPDFRLQNTSPCKNTGNPGYLNVDGKRSDMGSFGGPGAALFWPYGDGGPVVTNLTIDPPYVPEGGNISIKATVEIR